LNKWQRREQRKKRQLKGTNPNARIHLGTNRFHIYAKYRFPGLKSRPDNITRVDIHKHAEYHQLFKLRTPEEVLQYLNTYFWGVLFILEIKKGERDDCLNV
jgi:hypothetical protein